MKSSIMDYALFKNYLEDKNRFKESTIYVYSGSLKKFLEREPEIDKLDDYNQFLIEMTIKKNSSHYYSVIKAYIEFKIQDAALKNRLISGLIQPQIKDPITPRRYLSPKRRIDVINNLEFEKHKVIAVIQAMTGVRAGDILRLKRAGGIMYEEEEGKPLLRMNVIGKRDKVNVIHIYDPIAQDLILMYINNNITHDKYYFLGFGKMKNRKGLETEFRLVTMNYNWYWADLKQALMTAGVSKQEFATHDFRRCFAREIWTKFKGDINILQNALYHQDPKTTLRYLRHSGLQNRDVLKKYQLGL